MNRAGPAQAPLYGIGAEFASADALRAAAAELHAAGFTRCDFFSPFPVSGLGQGSKSPPSRLGLYVFLGGLLGLLSALALVLIPSNYLYPVVVMGKPTGLGSLPAFFPVLFECTILCSALTAFIGLFLLIGLPRWNHPLFNWDDFRRATDDAFFCVVESSDARFHAAEVSALLASLGGQNITEVRGES